MIAPETNMSTLPKVQQLHIQHRSQTHEALLLPNLLPSHPKCTKSEKDSLFFAVAHICHGLRLLSLPLRSSDCNLTRCVGTFESSTKNSMFCQLSCSYQLSIDNNLQVQFWWFKQLGHLYFKLLRSSIAFLKVDIGLEWTFSAIVWDYDFKGLNWGFLPTPTWFEMSNLCSCKSINISNSWKFRRY